MVADNVTQDENEIDSGDAGEQSASTDPSQGGDPERLLTDGGEEEGDDQAEADEEDEEQEEEEQAEEEDGGEADVDEEAEETDEEEEGTDEESESEDAEDEDESGDEEGAGLIHLDLEGLFLDVLGLEVDLNEVVLDVSAQPGSNRLLGNLLSAVSGLLDGAPGSLLDGVKDSILGVLGDLFGSSDGEDGESDGPGAIRNALSSIGEKIREALTNAVQQLPIEEIIAGVVRELVRQLLDKPSSVMDEANEEGESDEGGEEAEAEA